MYWEEFWEHVVIAANYTAEEKNAEMRFHFMIHADKKSARKWRDLPLPFPPEKKDISELKDKSGVSQIPLQLQRVVYRPDAVVGNVK